MFTLTGTPNVKGRLQPALRIAGVMLSVLVAAGVAVMFLALIGANRTTSTISLTRARLPATYTRPIETRAAIRCHAVLDPVTGQMHGGCAANTPGTSPPTPAP